VKCGNELNKCAINPITNPVCCTKPRQNEALYIVYTHILEMLQCIMPPNRNEYQESPWGGGTGRPARKADNLSAICEPNV
jgi:hypothetical protein